MATKIELPLGKMFRRWLLIGSLTAVSTGVLFILLLTFPLVVFEGDFLNGNVAITWYSLRNYGEPVYHPGLSSIPLLSIPALGASIFNIIVGLLMISKTWKSKTISHVLVEILIGALEACMIFTGVFFSLRLNVIHAVSVLPTEVDGVNSAGLLVARGSVRSETFLSVLIRQFYPLTLLSILLLAFAAIIGYEASKVLEALAGNEEGKASARNVSESKEPEAVGEGKLAGLLNRLKKLFKKS
ncbi:MAG: hypothetical protein QW304_07265 [Thermoproteota archaeon]